jgi:hypothetical protein
MPPRSAAALRARDLRRCFPWSDGPLKCPPFSPTEKKRYIDPLPGEEIERPEVFDLHAILRILRIVPLRSGTEGAARLTNAKARFAGGSFTR